MHSTWTFDLIQAGEMAAKAYVASCCRSSNSVQGKLSSNVGLSRDRNSWCDMPEVREIPAQCCWFTFRSACSQSACIELLFVSWVPSPGRCLLCVDLADSAIWPWDGFRRSPGHITCECVSIAWRVSMTHQLDIHSGIYTIVTILFCFNYRTK